MLSIIQGKKEGKESNRKRLIPIWLVALLIILSSTGTAVAFSMNVLPVEHVSLWSGTTQSSNFNVISEQTSFKGPGKITVSITLKNTDASLAHTANVTVTLLDSSGNSLLNLTQSTGSILASAQTSMTFTFSQTGLTSSYSSTFVEIMDTA